MAIEDKILNFNILVIDDDLLVLPSLKSIYEFLAYSEASRPPIPTEAGR
jgi:hypothetical protein